MSIKLNRLILGVTLLLSVSCQSTSGSISPPPISATSKISTPTQLPAPTIDPVALAQTSMAANNQWKPYIRNFDGVDMVLVPAGCFMMGSETGMAAERPVSKQCFNMPFWFDRTEVTNVQFAQFGGKAANSSTRREANRPRSRLTWFEADAFCQLREARLPTEAEWEYAARGPDDLFYPWGNIFMNENLVWKTDQPSEVGSKPAGASWVGALDMIGNVWEWTSSLNQPYPYDATDGREANDSTDQASEHIVRGGSWGANDQNLLRSAFRAGPPSTLASPDFGLRCARSY